MDQQRYNLLMEKTANKFSAGVTAVERAAGRNYGPPTAKFSLNDVLNPVTAKHNVSTSGTAGTGMVDLDALLASAQKPGSSGPSTQVLRQRLSAKPSLPPEPEAPSAARLVDRVNRDESLTPGVRSRVMQLLQAIGDNPGRSAAIGGGAAALGLGAAALARRGRGGLSRNAKLGIGAGVAGGAGLAGLLASRD